MQPNIKKQTNKKKQIQSKMGGRLKQIFFQRHIDIQKAHEKMLNITNF